MRRLILTILILPALSACASPGGGGSGGGSGSGSGGGSGTTAAGRSVDAVAQDEGQRQKVLSAIQAGATPTEAMAKVADGPQKAEPTPAAPAPSPKS